MARLPSLTELFDLSAHRMGYRHAQLAGDDGDLCCCCSCSSCCFLMQ